MKNRVSNSPGRYRASISTEDREKMQTGNPFSITLVRDDDPSEPGTPYSKEAVLPDDLAEELCPDIADPTPADAFRALANRPGGGTGDNTVPREPLIVTIEGSNGEFSADISYSDIAAAVEKNQSVFAFYTGCYFPLACFTEGVVRFCCNEYYPDADYLQHRYFEIFEDGTIVYIDTVSYGSPLIVYLIDEDGKYTVDTSATEIHDAIITNRSVYLNVEELLYSCTYSDNYLAKFDVSTTTTTGSVTYLNYKTYAVDGDGIVTITETSCAPKGYGLGENTANSTSWAGHYQSGFYRSRAYTPTNTTNSTGSQYPLWFGLTCVESGTNQAQIAFGVNVADCLVEARRYKAGGKLQDWEYVNPPMVYGAEYRTTERWGGRPVYAVLVTSAVGDEEFEIELARNVAKVVDFRCILFDGAVTLPNHECEVAVTDGVARVRIYDAPGGSTVDILLKFIK